MTNSIRRSANIRIARERKDLDDLAVEALAIVQTATRAPPDPGEKMLIHKLRLTEDERMRG